MKNLLLLLLLLLFTAAASAQEPEFIPASGMLPGTQCDFIQGEFDFDCIPIYVGYLTQLFFGMTGGFALFEIIKGGYQYAMTGLQIAGDKEAAKARITWALVGLTVSILAFLIVDFVITGLVLGP